MLSPDAMEKAKGIQLGLQQFELRHMAEFKDGTWECTSCGLDFPCSRMLLFMQLQAITTLSQMIPTGNMNSVMARFLNSGGDKSK